jgi:hypothetical protein
VRTVRGSLRVVAGTPRVYVKTAESGNPSEQAFCEHCGTHVFGTVPGPEPKICNLRMGSIDQRDQLKPVAQFWTRSRLPWATELAALPEHETQ